MRADLLIFGFMVAGTLGGACQHFLAFETVAEDLTPTAFVVGDGKVNAAAKFWGGDFVAAMTFSVFVMAVAYAKVPVVREAFLVFEGVMFSTVVWTWWRKGAEVGNPQLNFVIVMDAALASLGFLGAWLTRIQRSQVRKLE